MVRSFFLGAVVSLFCLVSNGQKKYAVADLTQQNVQAWYDDQFGLENTQLQAGEQYSETRKAKVGHRFFVDNAWAKGALTYRGQQFTNVDLLYDIHADILITRFHGEIAQSAVLIQLNRDQVSDFRIHDRDFIFIKERLNSQEEHYYELLYSSDSLTLIARRQKLIEIDGDVPVYIDFKPQIYFEYQGSFIRYKGRLHLLYFFQEYRKELNGFIRQNNLNISTNVEEADLVELMRYCDQLVSR